MKIQALHQKIHEVTREILLGHIPRINRHDEIDIGFEVPLHVAYADHTHCRPIVKAAPLVHRRGDEILYAGVSIGNLVPDEGEEWMVKTLFDTLQSPSGVPNTYDLALLSSPARGAEAEGDTAGSVVEVVGNGYARIPLDPSSGNDFVTSRPSPPGDWQADTSTRTFTASAGSPLPWTTATQLALFNPDSPEVLVAIVALSADRTLAVASDALDTSLIIRVREAP